MYHASSNRDIRVLEPRQESSRDEKEGAVVFATPDKTTASMFIVQTDDSWAHSGYFGEVAYFVCKDKRRFYEIDKGVSIPYLQILLRQIRVKDWGKENGSVKTQ